jgi:hypothetical protein
MDPDQLLADQTLNAAVGALAARNAHHLEGMDAAERDQAAAHWRELAVDVLTAARSAMPSEGEDAEHLPPAGDGTPGRAVLVFEDAGGENVAIHAAFHPQLEDLGDGQLAGTAAQITAMSLLQQLSEQEQEQEQE